MSRKTKELGLIIDQLKQELAVNKQLQTNLECEVAVYRAKEAAIVSALTEAQASALRIEGEAQARADAIIRNAELEAQERVAQADSAAAATNERVEAILAEANEEREKLLAETQAEATRVLAQARDAYDAYVARINGLNEMLDHSAAETKSALTKLEAFLCEVRPVTDTEFAFELMPREQPVSDPLPDEYDSPADLMKTIYAIQNREIPLESDVVADDEGDATDADSDSDAEATDAAPCDEEDDADSLLTVDSIIATAVESADESIDAVASEEELNAIINDVLNV
ncbi:MAG: hypothetical protein Q4B99_03140 [Clostridia bacterium]|nr:hypothetical protein [Clostridia bacterium]